MVPSGRTEDSYYMNSEWKRGVEASMMSLRDGHDSTLKVLRALLLTPKGLRGVFSKKHSKTAVSSSRSPTDFFSIFFHF
jgi:hypothetical protein